MALLFFLATTFIVRVFVFMVCACVCCQPAVAAAELNTHTPTLGKLQSNTKQSERALGGARSARTAAVAISQAPPACRPTRRPTAQEHGHTRTHARAGANPLSSFSLRFSHTHLAPYTHPLVFLYVQHV